MNMRHHAHFPGGWISLALVVFAALFLMDVPTRMMLMAVGLAGYFVASLSASAVHWLGIIQQHRKNRCRQHLQQS